MNGNSYTISILCPFVLSLSKDSNKVFRHPARHFSIPSRNRLLFYLYLIYFSEHP